MNATRSIAVDLENMQFRFTRVPEISIDFSTKYSVAKLNFNLKLKPRMNNRNRNVHSARFE